MTTTSKELSAAESILASRGRMLKDYPPLSGVKIEEEGGCGVTGFACSIPVGGKHIFEPLALYPKHSGYPRKFWTAITCFRLP